MKLEDLVQNQNEKIDLLYNEYDFIMEDIKSSGLDDVKIDNLHSAGLNLFNFMDGCYAALDAAEESLTSEKISQLNDLAGLFSDALEETIPNHYSIMREYYGDDYKPSKHALAGLQQLIVQVKNKEEVKALKEKCIENNLPVKGFETKRRLKMTKTHERLLSIVLAILSVIFLAVLIPNIQEPTPLKYNFYCVLISILAGYAAAVFTGTLGLKTNKIKAKSGYAVCIIIFFILQGIRIFN
ncbi:hypothetical protein [Mangrovibacter phragmitis]|uniref:hypothetical protein n=1 Tax=Mangrovibacter phragmitis TaxID=1691903 RepID=UPI003516961B